MTTANASTLASADRETLLSVARESIVHGQRYRSPLTIYLLNYSPALHLQRATFTTLKINHMLRGCIGSLVATRPLVEDVAHSAFGAAFQDPRFAPLTPGELPRVEIHLSILSPPESIAFATETELLEQLRPGIDGVILSDEQLGKRGTFLPAVWESLLDRKAFLEHLKLKAGLNADHWSTTMKAWRYTAESVL